MDQILHGRATHIDEPTENYHPTAVQALWSILESFSSLFWFNASKFDSLILALVETAADKEAFSI